MRSKTPHFNVQDYLGETNNLLTVIGLSEKKSCENRNRLRCQCECGNFIDVLPYQFKNGAVKSCGCLKQNHAKLLHTYVKSGHPQYFDGRSNHPLYGLWFNMIGRCERTTHPKYYLYGARGISVCEEWHDFWKFVAWSDSVGGRPNGCTLDRKDNDGNYEPSNCRWATSYQQSINKSSNRIIEYNGESKTLKEWSEILGISWDNLYNRLDKGWSVERAFTEPIHYENSHKH